MKGKVLLGFLVLSGGLVISYQSEIRQTVSAETKESISSQQEMLSEQPIDSTAASTIIEETTVPSETSSIKETTSSEIGAVNSSTTESIESEKVPEESAASEQALPEADAEIQTPAPAAKVEENYQFSV